MSHIIQEWVGQMVELFKFLLLCLTEQFLVEINMWVVSK